MILLLPVLIPLAAAALMIATGRSPWRHRRLALAGSVGQLASCLWLASEVFLKGTQVQALGGWAPPYGIVFVADTLAALMILATGVLGLLGVSACFRGMEQEVQKLHLYPVLMALLAGVAGAFLTGDLFNLFVWFEVILMSSFVLMSLGRGPKQTPAALRYVALNLVGSALFLTSCGLIYGAVGTLNMAHLAQRMGEVHPGLAGAMGSLLIVAFLIKAAAFPLFGWLPSSYPSIPTPVAAIMAGLLTKVGVYAIFRLFTLVFDGSEGILGGALIFASMASMIVGVVGAYGQDEYRRILTFHIISQIGYMLAGVALGGPAALAGGIFMTLHNMAAKTGLFYLAGAAEDAYGVRPLKEIGGLRSATPWAARLFLICGLGLAGIPPLSGFFAKVSILQASVSPQNWIFLAVMLAVGVVTLLSMIKIWLEAYVKPLPEDSELRPPRREPRKSWLAPAGALALVVILLGVFAGPVQEACLRAGQELNDREGYIQSVMGGTKP